MYRNISLGIICCCIVKPQNPIENAINPLYHTTTDHHSKKPTVSHYAEVLTTPEVKMTPNPAYATTVYY